MVSEQGARVAVPSAGSPESEQPVRPVDLVYLSRYTLGERELEREVLELFCTQSVLYLEQLRASMSDKAWKDAAHALKGSASAIGAWRAAKAAERAESLHGDGLTQFRTARIDEIETSLREAADYIVSLLEKG